MELKSLPEFLAWAGAKGIGPNRHYPEAGALTFVNAPDHWHRWTLENHLREP